MEMGKPAALVCPPPRHRYARQVKSCLQHRSGSPYVCSTKNRPARFSTTIGLRRPARSVRSATTREIEPVARGKVATRSRVAEPGRSGIEIDAAEDRLEEAVETESEQADRSHQQELETERLVMQHL